MIPDPDKDSITEKKPIPLKWVLFAILIFALFFQISVWWSLRK